MAKLQGLYSVPTGTPFADSLARGMTDAWGDDPLAFADQAPDRLPLNPIAEDFNVSSKLRATTTEDGPNTYDFAVNRMAE